MTHKAPVRSNWLVFCCISLFLLVGLIVGVEITRKLTGSFLWRVAGALLYPVCYFAARQLWIIIGAMWEIKQRGLKGMIADTKKTFRMMKNVVQGEEVEVPTHEELRPGGGAFVVLHVMLAALFGAFLGGRIEASAVTAVLSYGLGGLVVGLAGYWMVRTGYIDLWHDSEDPLFNDRPPKKPPAS